MRKLAIDNPKVIKDIINYELRNFNADYAYVINNPEINGVAWYEYFWDDKESKEEFLSWLTKYLKKNVLITPKLIDTQVRLFDLYCGLKVY